jgi:hypothetical protein
LSAAGDETALILDGVEFKHPTGARLAAQVQAERADVVLEPTKDVRITFSWGSLDKTAYKTLEAFAEGAVKGLQGKLRRCRVSDRREASINGHPSIEQRLDESRRGLASDRRALAVNFFCPESNRYFGVLLLAHADTFADAWDDFRSTLSTLRCHG